MDIQFLSPGDPCWDTILAASPYDCFAMPAFVALSARREGARAVAAVAIEGDRHLLIPLLLRPIPDLDGDGRDGADRFDASSPYGYPGIVASPAAQTGPGAEAFVEQALGRIVRELAGIGVVSLFLRLHPLMPVGVEALRRLGTVVDHGATVSIDLRQDEAAILGGMRRSYAKHLRKLERHGFTVEVDDACRDDSIAEFVEIYTETMDRVGAARSYYVDANYVRDLRRALDGEVAITRVRQGDTVAVSGMITTVNGIVQDYLGGTRTAFLPQAPVRLEVWHVARWARARGGRRYHLGGGVGGAEDSLFAFKSGFSPDRHPFQTARIIVDPPVARRLERDWSRRAGRLTAGMTGFFPSWRAALVGLLCLC